MSGRPFGLRRAIATSVTIVLVTPLVILAIYVLGRAGSADREQRIRELEATQTRLYEMLAAAEARIEAQRRIYMSRFRAAEALLLAREQELLRLKSRARAIDDTPPSEPTDRRPPAAPSQPARL